MRATKQRRTNTPGSGDQPVETVQNLTDAKRTVTTGPTGRGPNGFRVPGADTLKKGTPADEKSPKAIGPNATGGQDAAIVCALTEQDRRREGAFHRDEVVRNAMPADAERQRYAPDRDLQLRIPETVRDDEPESGLGKGVAVPPGSVARRTGQTP